MEIKCLICHSPNQKRVLVREGMPVYQNLLIDTIESAKEIVRGDINIFECVECGFVYNHSFDQNKVVYSSDYENTQSYSNYFNQYLNDMVANLVDNHGIKDLNVVEVGCGKGVFLKKLVEFGNNRGYGFDPSYIGPEVELHGRLKFEKRLYDENCSDIKADVVICRHVIEHIPDPVYLLKVIRKALKNSPNARVYFETPCVDWIFDNKVVFDFFYEHCSYFNRRSLSRAFELSGFKVISIEHIFNDQYMWLEAKPVEEAGGPVYDKYSKRNSSASSELAQYELKWIEKVKEQLYQSTRQGKAAIWGAGAKGVTFLNLMDSNHEFIDCVVDVNPNKVGKFIPGTGHEIIGTSDLISRGISTVIVMNPNYIEENKRIIEQMQLDMECIGIEELVN